MEQAETAVWRAALAVLVVEMGLEIAARLSLWDSNRALASGRGSLQGSTFSGRTVGAISSICAGIGLGTRSSILAPIIVWRHI